MTNKGTTQASEVPQDQLEQVSDTSSDVPVTPSDVQVNAAEASDASAGQSADSADDKAQYIVTNVGKKRIRRKTKLVNAEDVISKPSFWPIVLALGIAVILFGIMAGPGGPIVLGVGAVLIIVALLGWILERR